MVEINWGLLITQVATFLVAMVILWKFSWGPLTKMMEDRSKGIKDDIERAEKGRNEIEALEADYHRRLAEIEEKARKEINDAIQKGHQEKELILKEAREESQHLLEKNQEMLAQERQQVIRELRGQVTDIVLKTVEQLVGENADAKAHGNLVDRFIKDLEEVGK